MTSGTQHKKFFAESGQTVVDHAAFRGSGCALIQPETKLGLPQQCVLLNRVSQAFCSTAGSVCTGVGLSLRDFDLGLAASRWRE